MMHPVLYRLRQALRIVSLVGAAALALGLGTCNLAMLPSLIREHDQAWASVMWLIWAFGMLLALVTALSVRTTWRQFVAAREAQRGVQGEP